MQPAIFAGPCILLLRLFHQVQDLLGRHQAHGPVRHLTALEHQQGGDALDAELHGKKERCRCFAGTGDADKNHIRFIQAAVGLPVVVLQRVVDCRNASLILLIIANAVRLSDAVFTLHAEFRFQRTDELAEEVDDVAGDQLVERTHDVGLNESGEDDRAQAFLAFNGVDAAGRVDSFFDRVNERDARLVVVQVRELREDGVRERFGRNAAG